MGGSVYQISSKSSLGSKNTPDVFIFRHPLNIIYDTWDIEINSSGGDIYFTKKLIEDNLMVTLNPSLDIRIWRRSSFEDTNSLKTKNSLECSYCTEITSQNYSTNLNFLETCSCPSPSTLDNYTLNTSTSLKCPLRVIAFCLYGKLERYTLGAIKNAELALDIYPDWQCWFYIHQPTVPKTVVDTLREFPNVRIIFKQELILPTMWRYLPLDSPDVDIFISRDSDSILSFREKSAVDEWISSGKRFHVIRDHPYHPMTVGIMAGMVGFRKMPYWKGWNSIFSKYMQQDKRRELDGIILKTEMYPLAAKYNDLYVSATFHRYESDCHDIPINYDEKYHFIGEVWTPDEKDRHYWDIDAIKVSLQQGKEKNQSKKMKLGTILIYTDGSEVDKTNGKQASNAFNSLLNTSSAEDQYKIILKEIPKINGVSTDYVKEIMMILGGAIDEKFDSLGIMVASSSLAPVRKSFYTDLCQRFDDTWLIALRSEGTVNGSFKMFPYYTMATQKVWLQLWGESQPIDEKRSIQLITSFYERKMSVELILEEKSRQLLQTTGRLILLDDKYTNYSTAKSTSTENATDRSLLNSVQPPQNSKIKEIQRPKSRLRFFNLDLHISVIRDVKSILFQLYPEIEIVDWSISGHVFLVGKKQHDTKIINANTWKQITPKMIEDFNKEYSSFLSQFDGFIVTHTPVFALLYEQYNKPIIMVNSCRYEQPFNWNGDRKTQKYLETKLRDMVDRKQLIPIANNLADSKYLELGTGIKSFHIPSFCAYTETDYTARKRAISPPSLYLLKGIRVFPSMPDTAYLEDVLKLGYTYEQLFSYKGIIHLPSEISTMSIFEQYTANIPLFFPSKSFLKSLLQKNKIGFCGPYTRSNYDSRLEPAFGKDWIDFWIDKADYYDENNMPHITYYNDFDELKTIVTTYDEKTLSIISEKMKNKNQQRKLSIYSKWSEIMGTFFPPLGKLLGEYNFLRKEVITTDKFLQVSKEQKHSQYVKTDVFILNKQINWRGYLHPEMYPLQKKHLLITGHSDYTITPEIYHQHKEKFDYLFGINMDVERKNTIKYPLGITNDCDDSPIHRIYGNIPIMEEVAASDIKKNGLIYCNINTSTHPERKLVHQMFTAKSFVTVASAQPTLAGRKHFLEDIKKHQFVLCPRGNGPDTHRLWETLYMGSIPITRYEEAYSSFINLPILFVMEWEELQNKDTAFFQEKYREIMSKKWHLDRINFSYWKALIEKICSHLDVTEPKNLSEICSRKGSPETIPSVIQGEPKIASKDEKGIWDLGELSGYKQLNAIGAGQINLNSPFGELIKDLSANNENKTFLEVGTWNGLGSTKCFMEGFKDRKEFTFYSLECNPDKCHDAQKLYQNYPNVHILNEVFYDTEPSNIDEIFPELKSNSDYLKWYRVDIENMKKCDLFLERKNLPEFFDVVLLDGGEFTTYFEFQAVKNKCRVLLLDDTKTNKCRKIVEEIKSDPTNWEILFDRPDDRNGWLACVNLAKI
jgi:hypothetical protein